mgnify:CR=1 FL=1
MCGTSRPVLWKSWVSGSCPGWVTSLFGTVVGGVGCRGDEWKWSCEGEGIEQEIACAWWHAWEDLSIEQRSASEMLGYHVKHGSGSWRNTTNQNAERWGPGECPCILLPQSAYDSCSDLSTCDSCSDLVRRCPHATTCKYICENGEITNIKYIKTHTEYSHK